MHIASLIARPGTLTPEIAEGTFKALLCSAEPTWLAPLEAAEALRLRHELMDFQNGINKGRNN